MAETDGPTDSGQSNAPTNKAGSVGGAEVPHDRVQMASRHADGTLADNNPEFIGDRGTTTEMNKEQLRQIAGSNLDQANGYVGGVPDEDNSPDPETQRRIDEQRQAHEAAEAQAESEIDERHQGVGD